MFALIVAVAAAAFTAPTSTSGVTNFDWQVYVNGSPTSTYIENKTQQDMLDANPDCNTGSTICFRAWNLGHTVATSTYLKHS